MHQLLLHGARAFERTARAASILGRREVTRGPSVHILPMATC